MRNGDPFSQLHDAVAAACYRDLPDIEYFSRDWLAFRQLPKEEQQKLRADEGPGKKQSRRPMTDELEIRMFPQTWGSTAVGYGGMGGSAMTTVYTILVTYHGTTCVYFGCGRLAYKVEFKGISEEGRLNYHKDIAKENIAPCGEQGRYK